MALLEHVIRLANWGLTTSAQLTHSLNIKNVDRYIDHLHSRADHISRQKLKVALVKLPVQLNLYTLTGSGDPKSLLSSSIGHTGPLGLFTRCDGKFFIVNEPDEPQYRYWTEKAGRRGHRPLQSYYEAADAPRREANGLSQREMAVDAASIDWSQFDVVIALDACIAPSIIAQHPNTLWCYMMTEPNMPSWRKSFAAPLAGYDLFLTQRPWSARKQASHVVDFPWAFQYPGIFEEIMGHKPKEQQIYFERNLWRKRTTIATPLVPGFKEIGPSGDMISVVDNLMRSRFFAFYGHSDRRLWGNAVIEAMSANVLPIGGPGNQKNREYLLADLACQTDLGFISVLRKLENDPELSSIVSRAISRMAALTCFNGPLSDISRAQLSKTSKLSQTRF